MKVLQVTSPTTSAVLDMPVPSPGPGQVLMRVEAVTTCPQWDLHLRHNEPMFVGHRFEYPYAPGQPGHEATGYVEAVGDGVTGLAAGDRISAWRDQDHRRGGCYAQFVLQPAENVVRVPAGLPDVKLASLELAMCVATVFRMLEGMDALRGRSVGVTGLGPAGLIAVQMAQAAGAGEVLGFDPLPERRELAQRLGASACFDPTADPRDSLPAWPEAPRLETGIDCVGASGSVRFLMDHTAEVVALFGVQREDFIYAPHHARLTLCGYKGHSRASADYALSLIEAGQLDLEPLVTHRLPLERYGEGVDLLEARKAIKICFLPWATT